MWCEQSEKDDRHSDPNLEEKLHQTAKALNEEKRKSARRKEYVQYYAVLLCYCGQIYVLQWYIFVLHTEFYVEMNILVCKFVYICIHWLVPCVGLLWLSFCRLSAHMWKIWKRASGYDLVYLKNIHAFSALMLNIVIFLGFVEGSLFFIALMFLHCDLTVCWQCYMNDMTNSSSQLPLGIAGREDVIFGNILEIHEFHKKSVDFLWHISFKFLWFWECVWYSMKSYPFSLLFLCSVIIHVVHMQCLQCFDAVGFAAGRASGL